MELSSLPRNCELTLEAPAWKTLGIYLTTDSDHSVASRLPLAFAGQQGREK
jgi:hypothetical protein